MKYHIYGTIIQIGDLKVFNDYSVKEVVVKTGDEKYPQYVNFSCGNKMIDRLDEFTINEEVSIEFNLKGREHKESGRYYNTIQIANINPLPKADASKVWKPEKKVDDLPY